jgi:hypothetical protein
MFNLRYHIASLAAVFLALAVGLVLGSIVVERGTIDRQQTALVKSLQTDFVRMTADNKSLDSQVAADAEFEGALVPYVTQDALVGRTILVIANAGRTDGLSSVVGAIEAAGGRAPVAMFQGKGLLLDQENVLSAISGVVGSSLEGAALQHSVVATLAEEWSDTGGRPLTDALVSADALRIDGLAAGQTIDGLVTLASWDGEADPLTVELGTAAKQLGVAVVGAQPYNASTGVAAAFAGAGLDAVNDAGGPRGNYSLIMLLAGRASGYYGTGSATDALFPALTAR